MFEKLILKNFQPHKKLVIEFDDHVTCIIGPTDVGKSAIVRALRWICLNKIGSKRFISWWAKSTTVSLTVDGHVVKRSKGKANLYKLDGQVYKAFGTTVPDPIARLLNVSEENFQRQIDPPLWLSSSPAQVGRELNRIVNLDVIDSTLTSIARSKREAQTKVQSLVEVKQKLRREVKDLEWIVQCEREWSRLERIKTQKHDLSLDVAFLSSLLEKATVHKRARNLAKECLVDGRIAVESSERVQVSRDHVDTLEGLINRIDRASARLYDCRRQLESGRKKLDRMMKKECPLCHRPT